MATDIPARLKKAARPGRRFGLEVGIASAVVASLLHRREPGSALFLFALGVALVICALARPSLLAPIARRWLALGAALSRVTTPIVLAVLYLVVVTPMAVLRRTLGQTPFRRDPHADSYWITSTARTSEERRSRMERQF